MTELSFKEYLKKSILEESIPTVWNKKHINVVSNEDEEENDDFDEENDDSEEENDDFDGENDDSEEENDDLDDEDDLDGEEDEPEDPNKMGVIRKVKGAHLVYKRQDEEGTYEELWMYKAGENLSNELDTRRDVLAGTDIEQGKTKSEDGSQTFELWTTGNVQFLHIQGLPN